MIYVGMDVFCQIRLPMQDNTNNAVTFHHIPDTLLACLLTWPSYLQRIRSTYNSWLHLISRYTPEYTYHMHACKALPPLNQPPIPSWSWSWLSMSHEHVFLQHSYMICMVYALLPRTTTPYVLRTEYMGYVLTKQDIPCLYPSTKGFTMRHWHWQQHLFWLAWAESLLTDIIMSAYLADFDEKMICDIT